jgi:hypothetical protein
MSKGVSSIRTFEQLEQYLREFTTFHGDPAQYDYVAAFMLFSALLENLARFSMDADYDSLFESGFQLSEEQRRVLERLLRRA